MTRALEKAKGLDFYRELGRGMSGVLRCAACGWTAVIDEVTAGQYVRHGYPDCCSAPALELKERPEPRP